MNGLHVVCGYTGGKGFAESVQAHLNRVLWSETLAVAGPTAQGTSPDSDIHGQAAFLLTAGVAGWVAFGTAPDASADPRLYLAAGETKLVYVGAGQKVDWLPEGAAVGGFPLGTPTIVVGAETNDVINVAIQLKDSAGNNLAVRAAVEAYLSDDANGDSVAGTAPDTVAIGTDGLAIPLVAGKRFTLVSEPDGTIDLDIGEDGADTWYLVLVMPDGALVVSGEITFAGP